MFLFQANILHWEHTNSPWDLPAYFGQFSCSLAVNWTWITNGGSITVPSPPPRLAASSEDESEVVAPDEDEELPSLQQVVLKVQQSDDMKHVLNKGPWVATPVVHQGWKVFIHVSHCFA